MTRDWWVVVAAGLGLVGSVTAGEPIPAAVPPGCSAGCEKTYNRYDVHYVDKIVEAPVLQVKPAITECVRPKLEVEETTETRVVTEMVLKPKEVIKEQTICTWKPCETIDPATGCKVTTLQQVTETKLVKEIVYIACPEEKVIAVKRLCLKPGVENVREERLTLHATTELQKHSRGVLVPTTITERVVKPASPCCHDQ